MTDREKVLWAANLLLKDDGADFASRISQLGRAFDMTRKQTILALRSCQRKQKKHMLQNKINLFFKEKKLKAVEITA